MRVQSDLFANSVGEMLAEIRIHGGGEPPRFIADTEEEEEEEESENYYSPVQFAEELRRHERG